MPAFRPSPSDSPVRVATWLFFRAVAVLALAAFFGMVAWSTASTVLGPPWEFVSQILVFASALWIVLWVLFEAFDAFLEAKLESLHDDADRGEA